jgi:hypothetical protein
VKRPSEFFDEAMRSFQFSLRWLLGATAFIAVATAILTNPTAISAATASALTIPLVCYPPIAAVALKGERRAFWIGVAIAALLYLHFIAGSIDDVFQVVGERLGFDVDRPTIPGYFFEQPEVYCFSSSARKLLTWPIALIGGMLGRHLYKTRQDEDRR